MPTDEARPEDQVIEVASQEISPPGFSDNVASDEAEDPDPAMSSEAPQESPPNPQTPSTGNSINLTGTVRCELTGTAAQVIATIGCRLEGSDGNIQPLDNPNLSYTWTAKQPAGTLVPIIGPSTNPDWQQVFEFNQEDHLENLSAVDLTEFVLSIKDSSAEKAFSYMGKEISFAANPCQENNAGIGFRFQTGFISVTSASRSDGTNQASFWIEELGGLTSTGNQNTIGVNKQSSLTLTGTGSIIYVLGGGKVTAEEGATGNVVYYTQGAELNIGVDNKAIQLRGLEICKPR